MAKKLICPHCGSKDVEKHSEYFVCNSCKNSFGRVALSDEGIHMKYMMQMKAVLIKLQMY